MITRVSLIDNSFIDSIKIYIYIDDHNPPHFHTIYVEFEELIIIESLATYTGQLPKAQRRKVINWAYQHKEYLIKIWKKYNSK